MAKTQKKFRILSLDGGGIRGIIPALLMAEIEKRTGKQMYELFDFIAGTSTGGLLSLALSLPVKNGKPYPAIDLVRLYEEKGKYLFQKTLLKRIIGANLVEEKYDQASLEKILHEYFHSYKLSETMPNIDVLITAYEIERRKPWFFKSHRAKKDKERDFLAWHVARSTSAAPTYFEPFKINLANNEHLALVDGGVFANNPALCAFAEAKVIRSNANADNSIRNLRDNISVDLPQPDSENEFFMLSIGTGTLSKSYKYEDAVHWGQLHWLNPLLDILMQGVNDTVDYQMQQLLPNSLDDKSNYYRFQTVLNEENEALDNVEVENIRLLKQKAQEMITHKNDLLDELCERLLEMGKISYQ